MTTDGNALLQAYGINSCLECGRCTAVCPVAPTHTFSPRRLLSRAISGGTAGLIADRSLWDCLTCRRCEQVCPREIPYAELNRAVRSQAREIEEVQSCTHGGIFEQICSLMMHPKLKQDRLGWITDDLKVRKTKSDTLFFTGCTPYFAAYFGEPYAGPLLNSLRAAVRLLNEIGIKPLLLANERCCGHDLLLRGEQEKFESLARSVAEQIRSSGVERVVFSCPECLTTLRNDYPAVAAEPGVELVHISTLLAAHLEELKFRDVEQQVTFQDPCRLGRYEQIYEEPRSVLQSIPGLELTEMEHNRKRSICCGTTAWIGCNAGTRVLQQKRLGEARATGSELLLTACPKCLIHLTCSQAGQEEVETPAVQIRDSWDYMAEQLEK